MTKLKLNQNEDTTRLNIPRLTPEALTFCSQSPLRPLVGSQSFIARIDENITSQSNWALDDIVNSSKMLPQRIMRASALCNSMAAARRLPMIQRRGFLPSQYTDKKTIEEKYPEPPKMSEAEDPDMNGGYINPPRIKRQHRDPYADWWDPQERRNFGEPIHEDNDVLGMFSPHDYTWTTTGPGLIMIGTFLAAFAGVSTLVYMTYPDRPTFPREFPGGLERELGGPGATRARMEGDEDP